MICQYCKETRHTKCRGRLWCDCQHRGSQPPVDEEARAAVIELTQLAQEMETSGPALPPEILDAVDRAFTEDTWIRRGRLKRKTEDPPPGHVCTRECDHDRPDL